MAPQPDTRHPASSDDSSQEGVLTLLGLVERVTYHDERSLYTVLRVAPEGALAVPKGELFAATRVTAVGRLSEPAEGLRLRFYGTWTDHRTHGTQFEFESAEVLPPVSEKGLVRYLASKAFEGIGETLAKRIVKKLGPETLETIRDHPDALTGIRGLRPGVVEGLVEKVRAELQAHQTAAFLRGLGLGPLQTRGVVQRLGPECEAAVRDNPYLIATVPSLGFATADRVARSLGFADDDPRRLAAGVSHSLQLAAKDGHSLTSVGRLLDRAEEVLSDTAPRDAFRATLERLEGERQIVFDRTFEASGEPFADSVLAYLPWLHASECGLAENLAHLTVAAAVKPLADDALIEASESHTGIELHPLQREAVKELLSVPVGLLTGGPGVGKTTIISFVAALADAAGEKVVLASPTGRAAKRLAEATGRDASTIHRLLKFTPNTGDFDRGTERPIKAGLVIIDEISMLDVALAHHLVKAIRPPTRLVLVGDPDQLPSVAPGNVLADLIASERIPVARLTQIFRQGASSLIVKNAHRILNGELPELPERGDTTADFYHFTSDEPEATADRLVDVVTSRIPQTFGFEWTSDVQVIAPMYRGACGVDELNERLREAQGFGGREVTQGGRRWRIGDRVIHTRNNYEKEVFNGDMGRVVEVTEDGVLTVRYPEQDVVYTGSEVSDLRPAFAITVHRSQGGEFPVVVIPLVKQHYMMLQRNLLYTAVTRAKRLVVLVGSRRALQMAIDNAEQKHRESALVARLQRRIDQLLDQPS